MNTPTTSYMICATPRSGSTLLCEALKNTGVAGNPDEYFGPMHVERWLAQWGQLSKKEYLDRVLAHGMGINGVFGMKVMRSYWGNFRQHLHQAVALPSTSDPALLNACFPNLKYIWITRRDKVRQAVSWLKFIQGAMWYWESDVPQKVEVLEMRPEIISDFILQTAVHESAWLAFFEQAGIQPHIVVYEDFVEAYEETAKDILNYLEIPYPKDLVFGKRRLKQQSDALTETWVAHFLALNKSYETL